MRDMPIIIKDFEWSESEAKLDIIVPQKGIRSAKIDIMVTPLYVKVNYSPYFFELHLKDEIDNSRTRIVFEDNKIKFYLIKVLPSLWEVIVNPEAKDPLRRRDLVAKAFQYHEKKVQEDVEKRKLVKAEQNKIALRTAMDQESQEKDRIESVKQAERNKVAQDMNEWHSLDDDQKEKQYLNSIEANKQPEKACDDDIRESLTPAVLREESEVKPLGESVSSSHSEAKTLSAAEERAKKFEKIKHNLSNPLKTDKTEKKGEKVNEDKKKDNVWYDGPRKASEIAVSFSPRYFPSAARESLAAEEEAWIEKNMRAQTVVKPKDATDKDTKDEERNPMWLGDKAGAFYKMGNFPAAVNAYSEAIKISPFLPKLYINRASCYILLNLFEDAVMDCSRALDLLTPPVEANRLSRVRTLAKRGSALFQLGHLDKALEDYQLAGKLKPDDEALKSDIQTLLSQSSDINTTLQNVAVAT